VGRALGPAGGWSAPASSGLRPGLGPEAPPSGGTRRPGRCVYKWSAILAATLSPWMARERHTRIARRTMRQAKPQGTSTCVLQLHEEQAPRRVPCFQSPSRFAGSFLAGLGLRWVCQRGGGSHVRRRFGPRTAAGYLHTERTSLSIAGDGFAVPMRSVRRAGLCPLVDADAGAKTDNTAAPRGEPCWTCSRVREFLRIALMGSGLILRPGVWVRGCRAKQAAPPEGHANAVFKTTSQILSVLAVQTALADITSSA